MINRVVLVGRLTRDVELRSTTSGKSVASFTLAFDSTRKDEAGNKVSCFVNCVAYGSSAEILEKYTSKGRLIGVDGRLNERKFTRKDGTNGSAFEIIVNEISLLDSRKTSTQTEEIHSQVVNTKQDNSQEEFDLNDVDMADDDLPF